MAAQKVHKLLLANGFYLAGFNGFGGDFMGNIGQHRAEAHHITGAGDLENHGFAVAGGGRDFDLAETDDKDIPRGVALGKELGPAGMAHHHANAVVVTQRVRCKIAEHSQMAMLTIQTIFRRVM